MASTTHRLASNADGEFYVDSTCIDCATCTWISPDTFDGFGDTSRVFRQPSAPDQHQRSLMALIACPVGAIGTEGKADIAGALRAFPEHLEDGVHHCGYHARSSFGAASYFIQREGGNLLIDSPRFARTLVNRLEEMGGIDTMFLTHRDDIADHQKFADHFGCRRIIHEDDAVSTAREVEWKLTGGKPVLIDDELVMIPVPGHTKGSVCLGYRNRFMFTGDHLWWSAANERLRAGPTVCWYDWPSQIISMEKLTGFEFEWVLPGHGHRCRFTDRSSTASALSECIQWMKSQ